MTQGINNLIKTITAALKSCILQTTIAMNILHINDVRILSCTMRRSDSGSVSRASLNVVLMYRSPHSIDDRLCVNIDVSDAVGYPSFTISRIYDEFEYPEPNEKLIGPRFRTQIAIGDIASMDISPKKKAAILENISGVVSSDHKMAEVDICGAEYFACKKSIAIPGAISASFVEASVYPPKGMAFLQIFDYDKGSPVSETCFHEDDMPKVRKDIEAICAAADIDPEPILLSIII